MNCPLGVNCLGAFECPHCSQGWSNVVEGWPAEVKPPLEDPLSDLLQFIESRKKARPSGCASPEEIEEWCKEWEEIQLRMEILRRAGS